MDYRQESKRLALELKENEDKYISGELSLDPILQQTEEIYNQTSIKTSSTYDFLSDSAVLQHETHIARQRARLCKVHTLKFDPKSFSAEVKKYFGIGSVHDDSRLSRKSPHSTLWTKLGEYSKDNMYLVPTFNFMYGTFDADPVERVKKKRKPYMKDKLGSVTRPQSMDVTEISNGQDQMCKDATRILNLFLNYIRYNRVNSMCFYEFVIDPTSFSRTVENIFLVSLLLKLGKLYLFSDDQDLPFLRATTPVEANEDWTSTVTQCALSITVEEWMNIVKTFNFTSAKIPPSYRRTKDEE